MKKKKNRQRRPSHMTEHCSWFIAEVECVYESALGEIRMCAMCNRWSIAYLLQVKSSSMLVLATDGVHAWSEEK
jgi:hypothetical protein